MSIFVEPRTGVNRNGENAPRSLIRTIYRLGILIQNRAATVFLERDMKLSRFLGYTVGRGMPWLYVGLKGSMDGLFTS